MIRKIVGWLVVGAVVAVVLTTFVLTEDYATDQTRSSISFENTNSETPNVVAAVPPPPSSDVEIPLRRFDVSMRNSPACNAVINDPALLITVASQAVRQRYSTPFLENGEWQRAIESCHGPISSRQAVLQTVLSSKAWLDGVIRCGDPGIQTGGHPNLFHGEWCIGGWRDAMRPGVASRQAAELERLFVESAKCALHLEFPLVQADFVLPTDPLRVLRPRGWKPPKVLLLSLTLGGNYDGGGGGGGGGGGPRGANMGCGLLKTALARGWDVVLAEGPFDGLSGKYASALAALNLALTGNKEGLARARNSDQGDDDDSMEEEEGEGDLNDALVVFTDSSDVLAQGTPESVTEAFLDQPFEFVWSGEETCFPLGSWPFNLGVATHVCDGLFPSAAEGKPSLRDGPQFVNTGGWIATARAARVVLTELSELVRSAGSESTCYGAGTDQLLGNAAFLRHRAHLGVDSTSSFFASSPPELLESGRLRLVQQAAPASSGGGEGGDEGGHKTNLALAHPAYCYSAAPSASAETLHGGTQEPRGQQLHCPAFLHFNGGAHGDGPHDECLDALLPPRQPWLAATRFVQGRVPPRLFNLLPDVSGCSPGSLTIASVQGEGSVSAESMNEDPSLWPCGAGKRPVLCQRRALPARRRRVTGGPGSRPSSSSSSSSWWGWLLERTTSSSEKWSHGFLVLLLVACVVGLSCLNHLATLAWFQCVKCVSLNQLFARDGGKWWRACCAQLCCRDGGQCWIAALGFQRCSSCCRGGSEPLPRSGGRSSSVLLPRVLDARTGKPVEFP